MVRAIHPSIHPPRDEERKVQLWCTTLRYAYRKMYNDSLGSQNSFFPKNNEIKKRKCPSGVCGGKYQNSALCASRQLNFKRSYSLETTLATHLYLSCAGPRLPCRAEPTQKSLSDAVLVSQQPMHQSTPTPFLIRRQQSYHRPSPYRRSP